LGTEASLFSILIATLPGELNEKIAKERIACAYSKAYTDLIIDHPMEIFKGKVIST
jgi:hypothetical protein